jgi:glutathione S-transferase
MKKPTEKHSDYIIHGMTSSFFTKKLEAYFLVKGIPYQFVEMDAADMMECAEHVGVTQLPQVECPDGSWLTDTTPIIEHFESDSSLPEIRPKDPVAGFFSYFLEDCFDELLWAPALYYRWAFAMDNKRRSDEFTYGILSNGPNLPRMLNRFIISRRQKSVHIKDNGIVSAAHARYIEDLYVDLLDLLQPVFKKRAYLLGDRPCEADIGLFGPMFAHFSQDPTPQEIMHVRAPHLYRWLGKLWSTRPDELQASPEIAGVPEDMKPLMEKMAQEYLPYLEANQKAFLSGTESTKYKMGGLDWEVPTAPYRVYCLTQLQQRYQSLTQQEQQQCRGFLGDKAIEILSRPVECPSEMLNVSASSPFNTNPDEPVGRLWQTKTGFMDRLMELGVGQAKSKAVAEIKREGTSWLPIYFRHNRAK